MGKLERNFFERKPEVVAKELLGKFLVRKITILRAGSRRTQTLIGIIVETEAYLGPGDKASHSYKGKTERNQMMFGPAGHAYIYFTYGVHWLLNFVTEKEGKPSAVLIRAVEPLLTINNKQLPINTGKLRKLGSGPARLTKWLKINGELNGTDATRSIELFVADEIEIDGKKYIARKITNKNIIKTQRIGVDYAEDHKNLPLRFYIKENPFISKK